MNPRRPVHAIYLGSSCVSIFANEIDSPQGKRTLHSAVLQRRYREGNEVKYTTSFGVSELPGALRALALAQQWIEARDLNGVESNSE